MIDLFLTYIKDKIITKLHLYAEVKSEILTSLLESANKIDTILNSHEITDIEKLNFLLTEMTYVYANNPKAWKGIVITSYEWGKKIKESAKK